MKILDSSIFDLSPTPMWLEDFSQVKKTFEQWRSQGIHDLKAYLQEDLERVKYCSRQIQILHVNHSTLQLFKAQNVHHLKNNIDVIFQKEMTEAHINELVALWQGEREFISTTFNYTLTGDRLDIKLRAVVLPGSEQCLSRVLLTTEDITAYMDACRREEQNRNIAEARFHHSPTSLWVENFSRVKHRLDHLKAIGIEDFRTFLDVHPDFIQQCIEDIILLDVNQATLDLFGAPDKQTLFENLASIFAHEMHQTFKEQLLELWHGKLQHSREAVNYALNGTIRHVLLHFSVFPGYEEDWGLVQLALTDISARKKAESYLEYLGTHDVLTKLKNRAFYTDEVNRLQRQPIRPVSAIYIDMNGLKTVNDQFGHDAGDKLLRRMSDILNRTVQHTSYSASRIGGDEFVILMQGANDTAVQSTLMVIQELLNIDNQFYTKHPIQVAMGHASTQENESLADMLKRADQVMYEQKRNYYKYKELYQD